MFTNPCPVVLSRYSVNVIQAFPWQFRGYSSTFLLSMRPPKVACAFDGASVSSSKNLVRTLVRTFQANFAPDRDGHCQRPSLEYCLIKRWDEGKGSPKSFGSELVTLGRVETLAWEGSDTMETRVVHRSGSKIEQNAARKHRRNSGWEPDWYFQYRELRVWTIVRLVLYWFIVRVKLMTVDSPAPLSTKPNMSHTSRWFCRWINTCLAQDYRVWYGWSTYTRK